MLYFLIYAVECLQIQKLLMELYHVVLAVKNVQIVEEFYKCIMVDIMKAHSTLLQPKSDLTKDVSDVKKAEASLLLSICTLVEIGNVKHSLIRVSVYIFIVIIILIVYFKFLSISCNIFRYVYIIPKSR